MFIEKLKIQYHYVQGIIKSILHSKTIKLNSNKKTAYVMLAADYENLGDIAITKAQIEFLENVLPNDYEIISIPYKDTYSVYRCMKKNIKKDSIITLIGGGNSGSEYEFIEQPRRFILKKFRNTKIISFPQSYIYKKSKVAEVRQNEFIKLCNKCKKITLVAREEYTYKKYLEMLKDRRKVIMTPDIVFSMNVNNIEINNRKDRVFLVLRNDKEKFHKKLNANDIQKYVKNIFSECVIKDTCDFKNVSANKMQVLEEYIQELAKAKIVVTDRLHGMILSHITDTPCIVLRNNNHKIESTYYTWLNKCSNVKLIEQDDQELLIQEIKKMKNNINCEELTLDEKFEPLIKLIKDFVGEV